MYTNVTCTFYLDHKFYFNFMYELIVNFEIPYYVLELQVNTFILFCTVLRWLLIQPKHVAIDIVYKI